MSEENKETLPETPKEVEEKEIDIIDFFGLSKDEYDENKVALKVQEKLGTSLGQMQEALSLAVQQRAEELTLDFINIAPLGDYEKLLENNDDMAAFLKEEGHKPEHWKLFGIRVSEINKQMFSFIFDNMAVDDGTTFRGFVFISTAGKIKHAFAQVQD